MKVTFYGHATLLLELNGNRFLFDPFISPNEAASHIDVDGIEADVILLTHGHMDHVADVESIANRTGAEVIGNFEVANWFQAKGLEKVHPVNHGGTVERGGVKIQYVNAIHTSSMPDGSYGGQPGGFVVRGNGKTFYHSGDTALTMDMKLIGEDGPVDLAALCIGDNFTMGAADAARAAEFVNCQKIIGIHYDTFPPIQIDHAAAKEAFAKTGRELVLLKIGESLKI